MSPILFQVDRLLTEQEAQKASSEQEIANLWSQLESMRTSRQELGGIAPRYSSSQAWRLKDDAYVEIPQLFVLHFLRSELKEQLLARTSRVDDIERLKQDFTQQRRELQEQNEAELENLRVYFEQRLRASEANHREEITLLQRRLVEGALEDSALKTAEAR